jgi:hypothetical protein
MAKSVEPDLFHLIPVGDDASLDGIFEDENTGLFEGFIADVNAIGLPNRQSWHPQAKTTDDGTEGGSRSFVIGETGPAHSGPIVNEQGLNFASHSWNEANGSPQKATDNILLLNHS